MLGGYIYYTDDIGIHDCMWSGQCYSCQASSDVTPIQVSQAASRSPSSSASSSSGSSTSSSSSDTNSTTKQYQLHQQTKLIPQQHLQIQLHQQPRQQQQHQQTPRQQQARQQQHQSPQHQQATSSSSSSSSCPSENKKLRHREVEKNRHRQLQAMVRTLSDNIPGKLDKETQVQTMKRAARYCIYLRKVLSLLSSGQFASGSMKQKLEMLYVRSCENVDVIMTSSANK